MDVQLPAGLSASDYEQGDTETGHEWSTLLPVSFC